jgi:hypothetical protein
MAQVLHIPEEVAQSVFDKVRSGEKKEMLLSLKNRNGALLDLLVCGTTIFSPQGEYSGQNLLLRTLVESDYTLDDKLDAYQRSIVVYLQKSCGIDEDGEKKKLLLDYYLAYLKQLYNFVYHTGGGHLGVVFLANLEQTAREHQWQFQFDPQNPSDYSEYSLVVLRKELPVLVETARRFASQLTDPESVETEMQAISSQFSEDVHKNVVYCNKMG